MFCWFPPECEKNGTFTTLEEVGARSQVIGEVTKLNTLKHYEVRKYEKHKLNSLFHHSCAGLSVCVVEGCSLQYSTCSI